MKKRQPNFENVLKVMRREAPERPTLFELFMNMPLYELVNGGKRPGNDAIATCQFTCEAFARMGYDYATTHASGFGFHAGEHHRKESISLNEGAVITDERSYEAYDWPDPEAYDCSWLGKVQLPDGMKLMVMGPGGVLENVISLTGYDNLCFMVYEQPELVERLFAQVGERLVKYYQLALQYDSVGLISSNDDWGFNTQTFLSPEQMRAYVFPWHRKIVEAVHAAGRPVLLHSCGYFGEVIDDVVAMGYDAKHSYEDNIMPIEQAYEAWHQRIALLGGIDVNFICSKSEREIRERTRALIERTQVRGGYMVGTGNSVPEYIPVSAFMAMVSEAIGYNPLEG